MRATVLLVATFLLLSVPTAQAVPQFAFTDALDDVSTGGRGGDDEWRYMDIKSVAFREAHDDHYEWVFAELSLHSLGRINELATQPVHYEIQFKANADISIGAIFTPPTGPIGDITGEGTWASYVQGAGTASSTLEVSGNTLEWRLTGNSLGLDPGNLMRAWHATTWLGEKHETSYRDDAWTADSYRVGEGPIAAAKTAPAAAFVSDMRFDVWQSGGNYAGRGAGAVDIVSTAVYEYEKSWAFNLVVDDLSHQRAMTPGTGYTAAYSVEVRCSSGELYEARATYRMDEAQPWSYALLQEGGVAHSVTGSVENNLIRINVPLDLIDVNGGDELRDWNVAAWAFADDIATHGDDARLAKAYVVGTHVLASPLSIDEMLIKPTPTAPLAMFLAGLGALVAIRRR